MFTQDRGKVKRKSDGRVAIYAGSGVTTWGMQGDLELKKIRSERWLLHDLACR